MTKEMTNTNGKDLAKRPPTSPLAAIQSALDNPNIKGRINTRLGQKAGTFITSLLDLVGEDKNLAACDPNLIIKESLKAAALDLPISKQLGFAHIIPYKDKGVMTPHFQMGYKGALQLAIRSGQFRHLNAGAVYEGETVVDDRIRGTLEITGERTSDKAVGYFAFMQLINGFEKSTFWTRDKVVAHAKRFSKSYDRDSTPWKTDFDAMALKTMLLQLKAYFPMTIDMTEAFTADRDMDPEGAARKEIEYHANQGEVVDIMPEPDKSDKTGQKADTAQDLPADGENPYCGKKCDNSQEGRCVAGFNPNDDNCRAYMAGETGAEEPDFYKS